MLDRVNFEYDLYISYSVEDRQWALKLSEDLRKRGVKTRLDSESFNAGKEDPGPLDDVINSSQHLVVLWSKKARASNLVQREVAQFDTQPDDQFEQLTSQSYQFEKRASENPAPLIGERRIIFLNLDDTNQPYTQYQAINDILDSGLYPDRFDELDQSPVWQAVLDKLESAATGTVKSVEGASFVYIAYSYAHQEFAIEVANQLREAGFNPWIDRERYGFVANWREEAAVGFQTAFAFIVILSPEAARSNSVGWEVSEARRLNLPIIVLEYRSATMAWDVPSVIMIDFTRQSRPWDQLFAELRSIQGSATPSPADVEDRIAYQIAALALSDRPVYRVANDLLGYRVYAEALAEFILHPRTQKPLTIAIDGPWGSGKSSLMHMIREQLIVKKREELIEQQPAWRRWLARIRQSWRSRRASNDDNPEAMTRGAPLPTIWFNAWKYDEEEALWAALALAVINQISDQLGFIRRLKFKFRLRGFDVNALLKDMGHALIYAAVITLLGWAIAVIALQYFGAKLDDAFAQFIQYIPFGAGGLVVLYRLGKSVVEGTTKIFSLNVEKYLKEQPNYQERLGFIAEFDSDFKRIIRVVTSRAYNPIVIFIDDLDRCAVPKAAEIVEAINLFLDAQNCVFILGMDAPTVAASIEVRYEKLKAYFEQQYPGELSLGRRFLEKIVQISFSIPRLNRPDQFRDLIQRNLDKRSEGAQAGGQSQQTEPSPDRVQRLVRSVDQSFQQTEQRQSIDAINRAINQAQAQETFSPEELAEARVRLTTRWFDNLEEVEPALAAVVPYLNYNPRRVKRFMNLFRLQALIASRRGQPFDHAADLQPMARWLLIAIRWPSFVDMMINDSHYDDKLRELFEIQGNENRSDVEAARLKAESAHPITGQLLKSSVLEEIIDWTIAQADEEVRRHLEIANIIGGSTTAIEESELKEPPLNVQAGVPAQNAAPP